MSKKIARARKVIRNRFEKDRDFYYGYRANVAMVLYDNLGTDIEERNKIADLILDKIFGE